MHETTPALTCIVDLGAIRYMVVGKLDMDIQAIYLSIALNHVLKAITLPSFFSSIVTFRYSAAIE